MSKKEIILITNSRTIKNGGFEQALLKMADEDGLLNESDKKRLQELKSLPQNRVEILSQRSFKLITEEDENEIIPE